MVPLMSIETESSHSDQAGQAEAPVAAQQPGQSTESTAPPKGLVQLDADALEKLLMADGSSPAATPQAHPTETDAPPVPESAKEAAADGTEVLSQADAAAAAVEEAGPAEPPADKHADKLQKRFDELTAARKAAEAKAAELEQRLNALEAKKPEADTAPRSDPSNPFSATRTLADLEAINRAALNYLDWAEENPAGGDWDGKPQTEEEVRANRKFARATVHQWVPSQTRRVAEYQRDFAPAHQAAATRFPWLTDPHTPEAQMAARVMERLPALKWEPMAEMWMGYVIEGARADLARQQAAAKPVSATPKKAPPPTAGAPSAARPAVPQARPKTSDAGYDRWRKSGAPEDFESAMAAELRGG